MEKAGCCSTVRRVENLSLRAGSHDVRSGYVKRLWGGLPLPLPLGEVATRSVDGEGRHVKKICRWHIQAVEKACHCEPVRRLAWQSVGALRKHACGMFLASDLGGYAAVASILFFAALSRDYGFPRRFAPRNDRMGLSTRWAPLCKGSCQCEALTEGLLPCRELGNNPSVTLRGDTSPYTGDALKQMTRGDDHAAADRGGRDGSGGSADGVF